MGGVVSYIKRQVENAGKALLGVFAALFQLPTIPPPQMSQPPPSCHKSREQLIKEAREKLGVDAVNNYNFAVVGQSGSGKSSLVNAVRGVPDNDEMRAAKVGEVETTADTSAYPSPEHPHIVFWDLPGKSVYDVSL